MSHALYYPSIEFNDVESLKRSLLTWDRVFRIVPANYFPQDCSEVRTAQAEGRVMNLDVNDHEKSTAALGFLDFYQLRTSTGCMLTWPDGFSDETFTRLNPDKIDAKQVVSHRIPVEEVAQDVHLFEAREELHRELPQHGLVLEVD